MRKRINVTPNDLSIAVPLVLSVHACRHAAACTRVRRTHLRSIYRGQQQQQQQFTAAYSVVLQCKCMHACASGVNSRNINLIYSAANRTQRLPVGAATTTPVAMVLLIFFRVALAHVARTQLCGRTYGACATHCDGNYMPALAGGNHLSL